MKPKILIVDDYEEIRELVCFMIESHMEVDVLQANSGFEAIKTLKKHRDIQLIITDMQMPNGTGEDIFKFMQAEKRSVPMAFLTGDDLEAHPTLRGETRICRIPKPFSDEQLISVVKSLLKAEETGIFTEYIPVRLELLRKIHEIKTPLFVKINDTKYVRITQDRFHFDDEFYTKYENKKVSHLYVEFLRAQEFISEYRKRALSDLAWNEAGETHTAEMVKLNTELLRNLVTQVGWSDDLIELAQGHFKRALHVASVNPDLHQVFHQFHKIERYGYADHCTLMFLVSSKLAFEMNIADEPTLKKLTFAALFHDMSLTDHLYDHEQKIIKMIHLNEPNPSKDLKDVIAHPTRAAELCRQWDFCPAVVDTIIFQHHELPNGRGFPMGKRAHELHPLSCLFILCEDFVQYFMHHFGEPDIKSFISTRQKIYTEGHFKTCFECLVKSVATALQKAS